MFFKPKDDPSTDESAPEGDSSVPLSHEVLGTPLSEEFPGKERLLVGMGCFWGAERRFWQVPGVFSTAVGYAGGHTKNPTYQEVCTGTTGHNEVVQVIFDPNRVSLETLLVLFWESHNPTEGMRQGNDIGTQYRSGIYVYNASQMRLAEASRVAYQRALTEQGFGKITTEILDAPVFYLAEVYHQQYLAKHPDGYCSMKSSGVPCPKF